MNFEKVKQMKLYKEYMYQLLIFLLSMERSSEKLKKVK